MVRNIINPPQLKSASALLNAMGNPKRLAVLAFLTENEMSVTSLAERVELSQSALSQHLSKLRSEGLVKTRRDGQTIYYSCDTPSVKIVLDALEQMEAPRSVASIQRP